MEARIHTSPLEESAVVERVARMLSSVRGTRADYTRLAAELEQAIPFDVFGVVRLRHDGQALRIAVCHREAERWQATYHQLPLEDSKFAHVAHARTLTVANYPNGLDGPPGVSGDALSTYQQLHSTLIVPLVVEDRMLGTLELGSVDPDTYADKNLQRLVGAVAEVLAAAIESAVQDGKAAMQDRQHQVLQNVSSDLASKLDLPTVLNRLVTGITNALNVASMIILLDRTTNCLRLEAQSGLEQEAVERIFNRQIAVSSQCIFGQTLLRQQLCTTQDIATDERYPDSRVLSTELGLHSISCYPLATGATKYGVLLLASPEPGGFTPLKTDMLTLFASQATIAIQNGMLLESAHQRSHFQEVIEQLEHIHARAGGDVRAPEGTSELSALHAHMDELLLLEHVREVARQTFGVSLSSLLRFISDYLLTAGERDLQEALFRYQDSATGASLPTASALQPAVQATLRLDQLPPREEPIIPPIESLPWLTNRAETALVRTDVLSELTRLLVQLKQTDSGQKDAWFAVDLQGMCLYMNPVAEALCNPRPYEDDPASRTEQVVSIEKQEAAITLERAFANILASTRNPDEILYYLQEFSQGSIYRQELRYVVSSLSDQSQLSMQQRFAGREDQAAGSPSDSYYACIRYPLCNEQGILIAYALQVCDITGQVREEKNRATLLSSLSHDLRTPLAAIKMAVTGLLQPEFDWEEQDRRAMLGEIDHGADKLTMMVNALVELSRIEMGALSLEKEWCDVVEVLYGALAKMRRMLGNHPVLLHYQPRLPLIYVDHLQLQTVFCNLLENAVRRSPERAEIIIKLEVKNERLRTQIRDRGSAIPVQDRQQLFQTFRSLRSYGAGLGLAICKGIIDAHQGRIWVEAVKDGGESFVFTLPAHAYSRGGNPTQTAEWAALPMFRRELVEEEQR